MNELLKYTAMTDGRGRYWVALGEWVHPAGMVVLCHGSLLRREVAELSCLRAVPIYKQVHGAYSLIPPDRGYTLKNFQYGVVDYKHATAFVHRVKPHVLYGKAAAGRAEL